MQRPQRQVPGVVVMRARAMRGAAFTVVAMAVVVVVAGAPRRGLPRAAPRMRRGDRHTVERPVEARNLVQMRRAMLVAVVPIH